MEQCGTFVGAVKETLVLAFEFADKTVLNSPETIRNVIEDPAIRKAIEQAALAEAKRLVEAQKAGKVVTNEDGEKLLTNVGQAAQKAAVDSVKKQIESSDEFKKLKQEVERLGCALKQSPVGVFVDKNKGWLIVVGAGLAIGGATAMYYFRSGDFVAEKGLDLAQQHLRFKVLGNVELGAKSIKFVPSTRQVATTLFTSAKWDKASVRFELSVDVKDGTVQSAGAKTEAQITVAQGLVLTGTGSGGYQLPSQPWQPSYVYRLGLGLTYNHAFGTNKLSLTANAFVEQTPQVMRQGGSVNLNLNLVQGKTSSLNLGATGTAGNTRYFDPVPQPNQRSGSEFKGMLQLELRHNLF